MRIIVVWFPNAFARHGEARLLDTLIRGLEKLSVDYEVITFDQPNEGVKPFDSIEFAFKRGKIKIVELACGLKALKELTRLAIDLCKLHKLGKTMIIVRCPNEYFLASYLLCLDLQGFREAIISTGLFGLELLDPITIIKHRQVLELVDVNRDYVRRTIRGSVRRLPLRLISWLIAHISRYRVVTNAYIISCSLSSSLTRRRLLWIPLVVNTQFFYFNRLVSYTEPRLLAVSRISPEKNLEVFLLIIKALSKIYDDVVGTIVGKIDDVAYYEKLRSFIERHNIPVNIVTEVNDYIIREAYWSNNILINVSQGALGIVNAEASICGAVPVIHPYLVDAATPYAIVYRRYSEIVTKIIHILRNPQELRYRSVMGSRYAYEVFGEENFVRALKQLLFGYGEH